VGSVRPLYESLHAFVRSRIVSRSAGSGFRRSLIARICLTILERTKACSDSYSDGPEPTIAPLQRRIAPASCRSWSATSRPYR